MKFAFSAVIIFAVIFSGIAAYAGTDDAYEENDSIATSWDFSAGAGQWLHSYGGELGVQLDDDWFSISVPSGQTQVIVDCRFLHSLGDVDIGLYDWIGTLVAQSISTSDNEYINIDTGAPGNYFIRVCEFSGGGTGNIYDLAWNAVSTTSSDLEALSLDAPDGTYNTSDTITVSNASYNHGPDDCPSYTVRFYLSADINISATGDTLVGTFSRAAISTDSTDSYMSDITWSGMTYGDYYVGMIVTATEDTNLSNNVIVDPVPITLQRTDDAYEENDDMATAWDFTGGVNQWLSNYGGETGIQADDDWYKIDVPPGETQVIVDCTFTHADGDIDVELYDSSAALQARAASVNDDEFMTVTVPAGGTYYLRVYFSDQGNEYDLRWQTQIPAACDLQAVSVDAPDGTFDTSGVFTVNNKTDNTGPADCPGYLVDFYFSTDNVYDASDILLGSFWRGGLSAASSDIYDTTLTWTDIAEGSYYVIFRIEYDMDTDSGNNTVFDAVPVIIEKGAGQRPEIQGIYLNNGCSPNSAHTRGAWHLSAFALLMLLPLVRHLKQR